MGDRGLRLCAGELEGGLEIADCRSQIAEVKEDRGGGWDRGGVSGDAHEKLLTAEGAENFRGVRGGWRGLAVGYKF